jgi:hypothetical protein
MQLRTSFSTNNSALEEKENAARQREHQKLATTKCKQHIKFREKL